MTQLGGAIRRARRQAGMTQQQLAEKMSVSKAAVSRWESQKRTPDLYTLERIAMALGFEISVRFVSREGGAHEPERYDT